MSNMDINNPQEMNDRKVGLESAEFIWIHLLI